MMVLIRELATLDAGVAAKERIGAVAADTHNRVTALNVDLKWAGSMTYTTKCLVRLNCVVNHLG